MILLLAVFVLILVYTLRVIYKFWRRKPKRQSSRTDEPVYGYVYVLSNPSFRPGIFKIGMTKVHPGQRAKQIRSTGVPTHFNTCIALECYTYKDTEKVLHKMFASKRICKRREFFQLDLEDVLKILSHEGIVHVDNHALMAALEPL